MRAEISCIFHLEYHDDVVKEALIGSNLYLQEILSNNWRDDLLTDLSTGDSLSEARDWRYLLKAQQKLDWGPYTHRLFISLEDVTGAADPRIGEAKQLIARATVLSRIVHPTPIALGGTWIKSMYDDSGGSYHLPEIGVGFYGRAYVSPHAVKTLTQNDAARMAELWEPLQHFFNNEEKYRRIIRALKFFDGAYHMGMGEFRHIIFHAALESLICVSRDLNKKQITQRLPQLVPEITEGQASAIYELCCDFKHAAAPLQLMSPIDQQRYQATEWLEQALRCLLRKALSEPAFAELLADRGELARRFPVSSRKIKKSSIGDLIVRESNIRGGRPILPERESLCAALLAGTSSD